MASQIGPQSILSDALVWEAMLLLDKGRLSSPYSPEDSVRRRLLAASKRLISVDGEILIFSRTLSFHHDDPADRFISATAYPCKGAMALSTPGFKGFHVGRLCPS